MIKRNRIFTLLGLFVGLYAGNAQDASVPDTQVEPDEAQVEAADQDIQKAPASDFKRVKVDGVAAVVGDYVILESDIEKSFIDLKTQGASMEGVTPCAILGNLMESRLYAHQAVQDSLLVSDDEVEAQTEARIQGLVQQVGSMEKLLKFYNKENEATLRNEINKILKLQMLSEKMRNDIISEIEITPEEVRQFFNKIPADERPVIGAELEIAQIVKQPKPTDVEIQKVIDKLSEIKADVEDNGASFNVKAILYSQDPGSSSKGGLYEGITKQTGFAKEFKDVAFSLKEGQISDPFKTDFGYHIIYLEKIRGQERDVRHILIQPEISKDALEEARIELDSIRKGILDGKFTFAQAALNFSDEKETKFDGGQLRNPKDFGSRFELTNLDPTLYNQVRDLKDDEISSPILEQDPRGGGPKYKIIRITNRFDEHVADFASDYIKIQDLALTEKRLKAIKKWMDKHITDTYVSVSDSRKDCDFANNWVKE